MDANENTGRWTQEEHERFIQGLELYGKKWTKVAEVVRTRTTVQVRSHAQKYFQKVVKGKEAGAAGSDLCGAGDLRKGGHDMNSLRIPVPPPLQPYVPPGSADIATGLYHYLSPIDIPTGPQRGPANDAMQHHPNGQAVHATETVPTWYRQGQDIPDLLGQAEQLDWLADSGNHPSKIDMMGLDANGGSDATAAVTAVLDAQGGPDPNVSPSSARSVGGHRTPSAPPLCDATTPSTRGHLLPPASNLGLGHVHHQTLPVGQLAAPGLHVPTALSSTDSGMLPPPPVAGPPLDATFSSMEVDDSLFEALINEEELMTVAHDEEHLGGAFGAHPVLGLVEARS